MAKAQHKVVRAPKVLLRKLIKNRYLQFGQEDELQDLHELGLDIDAVPCGGLGEYLFSKLIKQRKEIRAFQGGAGYAIEEIAAVKRRKAIYFHIEDLEVEGDARRSPQRIRANIHNAYIVLSSEAISRANAANKKAIEEISHGHIEECIEYYIRAERSSGAADALSQVGKVTSRIATAKAKFGHRETQALRAKAIKLWRDEIAPKLSAQKAADEILGRIQWANGKCVGHRTLVEWISEEKRKGASPP